MPQRLQLFEMSERHPGLIGAIGDYYCEAAYVCLERQCAPPPADFEIQARPLTHEVEVSWPRPEPASQRAWANLIDAVEAGGYALSLAALEEVSGLVAIARAEQGTGADYYVGRPTGELEDFEDLIRLEVHGTTSMDRAHLDGKLRDKMRQLSRGKSDLPGLAAVAGFGLRSILISDTVEAREAVP